ncbi:MAG: hypothetical protein IPG89_11305 [Bacteroidetes bacterium]|nr:hypothetical protein [Bacteroidota bacterium]
MGYSAQPFAIDIEKVKSVFGSRDKELFDNAKKTNLYEVYESQYSKGEYDQCLEDIIFNYIQPSNRQETKKILGLIKTPPSSGLEYSGDLYGYALMSICEVLGTFLAKEGDIFTLEIFFDQANELLKEKGVQNHNGEILGG